MINDIYDEMVELVLKYNTKENPYLLDLGCYNGDLVRKFRKLGFNAFGIDISDKLFKEDYLILGNASKIEEIFKEQKFDFIISTDLLCEPALNKTWDNFLDICLLPTLDRMYFEEHQKETAHEIHNSIYNQLNDSGYSIHLTQEYDDIIAVPLNGFKIIEQNPNLLVLQK